MKTIGKYRVRGLLGKGGMAKVFKIEYPVTAKIGALKLLDPEPVLVSLLGESRVEGLFTGEAVTMAGIRHPHITEVFDFDRADGKLYYTMDFYANNLGRIIGENFETEKPSRKIRIEKVFRYTRQVLDGLDRLHWAGVIHRDIKPFNMLITEHDEIKIADFGLSKVHGTPFAGPDNLKVGSPYYTAPEQEENPETADAGSDLFSVGVMVFRMLTGKLPADENEKPSTFNADLDPVFDRFSKKALARDPAGRFRTADEMKAVIDELEEAWQTKKEKICVLPETLFDDASDDGDLEEAAPRTEPLKVYRKNARNRFALDTLMRPNQYVINRFRAVEQDLVYDDSTGLLWQYAGSRYPLDWRRAHGYISGLNRDRYRQRDNWRLPTVDELSTILSPPKTGRDHCIEPAFHTGQEFLWSADRCTHLTAWGVNLELGFVCDGDLSSFYHVKAVCTP